MDIILGTDPELLKFILGIVIILVPIRIPLSLQVKMVFFDWLHRIVMGSIFMIRVIGIILCVDYFI